MELNEALERLNKAGFLVEDRFGNGKDRYGHRINRLKLSDIGVSDNDEPITVDRIDEDNYEDYIGHYVNVVNDVYLFELGLTKLPIKFGKVGGSFSCSNNELTTLEGAPREVGGNFYCHHNKLTSLKGAPKKVDGFFNCCFNKTRFTEEDVRKIIDVGGAVKV